MSKLTKQINSEYIRASRPFVSRNREHVILVYVEGYNDVAFWRTIFNQYEYENPHLHFEISVPSRDDLAKGKKVLMGMVENCGPNLILCMDSDFDYLFGDKTPQSRMVNRSEYIFQTYTYSIENYSCYPPSLRSICVKATKNDTYIFDFVVFMDRYSQIIYPLFLWYAYSALHRKESAFTLHEFRNAVKINYLVIGDNGRETLEWLLRQTDKKIKQLEKKYPQWIGKVAEFGQEILPLGVNPHNVFFFMHGHTLQDYVVTVIVKKVCDELREMMLISIQSKANGSIQLNNELSNYKNAQSDIKFLLQGNMEYWNTGLFKRLDADIRRFVAKFARPLSPDDETNAFRNPE